MATRAKEEMVPSGGDDVHATSPEVQARKVEEREKEEKGKEKIFGSTMTGVPRLFTVGVLLASCLKACSLCSPGIISAVEPTTR